MRSGQGRRVVYDAMPVRPHEVPEAHLSAVIAAAERRGAEVVKDWNEPEGGRFIGTISGRRITLFPKYDSHFAMLFTVAHLYGHLAQLTRPIDAATQRAIDLVYTHGRPFTADEVQCLFDYEWEAAVIGRALLAEALPIDALLEAEYARMFYADFSYLVAFLEGGPAGVAAFDDHLRRTPRPHLPIPVDPRPLPDVRGLAEGAGGDAVVV